ncbi:adenosine deaminase [Alteromonas halophila]|uniref:adenosine deaminase n=1 Tax=Alteromonas halophila TaxID=516698 RepID=A0A918JPV6_9ALTE|nr:adenosine deaminase [Alteromonas halophila]GGW95820.1 adenosine deaminase [Alteromonas halophila]
MLNYDLPVVDLHRHLDGNVRPATIFDLAQQYSLPLPVKTPQALAEYVQIQDRTSDLMAFIGCLQHGMDVLREPDACRRIAYENVEDAAAEQLDYVELRFSPAFMAQAFNLSLHAVTEAVIDGVTAGVRAFGVRVGLLGILSRTFGVDRCYEELSALLHYRDALVGLDLAGDEKGFPGALFTGHFKKARDAGLAITVHAGEADGPASIRQAIDELGASRIGHGVAAVTSVELMSELAKRNIGIESCLTSNYQTGAFTDTANHPFRRFLDAGMAVTLNTDDPGVSAITLSSEYALAASALGLSESTLANVQQTALEQAFLSDSEKRLIRQKKRGGH